jgi:hypothetical protein
MKRQYNNKQSGFFCGAILSVIGLLGFAGCAAESSSPQSSSGGSGGNDAFARADANHDGKLSREETGDYLVYVAFEARDRNHDNRLTKEEWVRGDPSQVPAFDERDGNRDGVVTLEEAIEYGRRGGAGLSLMRKADQNRDGKLDRAELQAYYASLGGSSQ